MKYEFATLVVTTAVAANLRKLSQMLDRAETDGMMLVGLSATGALPATHFISTGLMPSRYINAVADPDRLMTVAAKAYADEGVAFTFTRAQVVNALSKCDYSTEEPFSAMARLGLKMIQGEA